MDFFPYFKSFHGDCFALLQSNKSWWAGDEVSLSTTLMTLHRGMSSTTDLQGQLHLVIPCGLMNSSSEWELSPVVLIWAMYRFCWYTAVTNCPFLNLKISACVVSQLRQSSAVRNSTLMNRNDALSGCLKQVELYLWLSEFWRHQHSPLSVSVITSYGVSTHMIVIKR